MLVQKIIADAEAKLESIDPTVFMQSADILVKVDRTLEEFDPGKMNLSNYYMFIKNVQQDWELFRYRRWLLMSEQGYY